MTKIAFKISARAARLIGRENVANAEGAIIELVKNGYDADANISLVVIDNKYFTPPEELSKDEFKIIHRNTELGSEFGSLLPSCYTPNNSKYFLNQNISEDHYNLLSTFFKSHCSIYIIDSGSGMTEDIITNFWMTIGTDNKENFSKSDLGRVKTGAKGIGRFALDRLGTRCEMTTKTIYGDLCNVQTKTISESSGYLWTVDWNEFEGATKVMADVNAELHSLSDVNIPRQVRDIIKDFIQVEDVLSYFKQNSGTILKIIGLRDDWNDSAVERVFATLETLAPPKEDKSYKIFLLSTLFKNKYGEVEPPILEDYDYKLYAKYHKNHNIDITIYRNELVYNKIDRDVFFQERMSDEQFRQNTFIEGQYSYERTIEQMLPGLSESFKKYNLDNIGEFDFTFFFGKLGEGPDERGTSKFPYRGVNMGARKEWLKKFGGIKLYRDGFKVRPYGEPNGNSFDWLGLGQRSSQSPTVTKLGYHVRPNQVYGLINISRLENIDFSDKSSREGIQENPVFNIFRQLIIKIIEEFERDRNIIMMSIKDIFNKKDEEEILKNKADAIIEKTHSSIAINDCEEEKEVLVRAIEYYRDRISSFEEEQMLLRVLASTGLIITSFAHELNNLTDRIIPRADKLREILVNVIDKVKLKDLSEFDNPYTIIEDFKSQDIRLSNWLGFSLAAVKKSKRDLKTIEIISYTRELERLWQTTMQMRGIDFEINQKIFKELYIDGNPIDFDAIFNNLITNSIDAFKRKKKNQTLTRKILITFSLDDKINIIYQDTGPGLDEEILDPNWILRPFNTTKRNDDGEVTGTGLGMYIVNTVIEQYNGDIIISDARPGFKAILRIPSKRTYD
ncbi:MAG TPA: sensor histidine kinase [Panacibacter sp.]|nr:sensor histidine kinase [Panacibacter sp.]